MPTNIYSNFDFNKQEDIFLRNSLEDLPDIVRNSLISPIKHQKPEEALAVIEACVSIGAGKAALAAEHKAILIIGNTG